MGPRLHGRPALYREFFLCFAFSQKSSIVDKVEDVLLFQVTHFLPIWSYSEMSWFLEVNQRGGLSLHILRQLITVNLISGCEGALRDVSLISHSTL